jgi:NADH dehydrogenase
VAPVSLDPRPVLVTGAAGWLGAALVPRLAGAGLRVRCLVHRRPAPAAAHERVAGDLCAPDTAAAALAGCGAVLHLAARTRSRAAADYREINVEATARLARAAAAAGIERFVHVSSRTAVAGAGAYGESKLAGEREVAAALPGARILRPAEVYGAGSDDTIVRLLEVLWRVPVAPIVLDARARVAPLYVDDFLDATLRALVAPEAPGGVYVLAGPEEMTLAEFTRRAARALGRRALPLPVPLFLVRAAIALRLGGIVPDRLPALLAPKPADIEPARRALAFAPRTVERGVTDWAARRNDRRAS